MPPKINAAMCRACGHCVEVCPTGTLMLRAKAVVKNPEKCIECRACEAACNAGAITF